MTEDESAAALGEGSALKNPSPKWSGWVKPQGGPQLAWHWNPGLEETVLCPDPQYNWGQVFQAEHNENNTLESAATSPRRSAHKDAAT